MYYLIYKKQNKEKKKKLFSILLQCTYFYILKNLCLEDEQWSFIEVKLTEE